LLCTLLATWQASAPASAPAAAKDAANDGHSKRYAVVISSATWEDADWRAVAEALLKKHQGWPVIYEESLADALPELAREHPRYTCFVARPEETSRSFVADVHRLTRRYDRDPYTDTFWGILTGRDAANALVIATTASPLVVRRVLSGTEVALQMCREGFWFDELEQNKLVRREAGGEIQVQRGPDDTTEAFVQALNEYQPDLLVTSGHATERDWQMGYRYRNGSLRSQDGQMRGVDTRGRTFAVNSPNPKIYLPVGNCLMGHIDGLDAMALAWMNDVGVRQMIGYTVPTWYGYAGWGCLDYFVEQPGRYTLAEAFLANQHALVDRLQRFFSGLDEAGAGPAEPGRGLQVTAAGKSQGLEVTDGRGLLFDRDVVAFYGDPAWEARMAEQPLAYEQTWTQSDGEYTLSVRPVRGAASFRPINRNGSQRGGRPIVQFFPRRFEEIQIVQGAELAPVVADDFLLLPNPGETAGAGELVVRFTAREVRRPAAPPTEANRAAP